MDLTFIGTNPAWFRAVCQAGLCRQIGIAEGIRARVLAITFMWTNVRADAQTTQTQEIAQLTTFMRTDVRADAQTIFALTAHSAFLFAITFLWI